MNRNFMKVPFLVFISTIFLAFSLSAQTTVTLNPAKDNGIYQDANGAISNGGGSDMIAGNTNRGEVRRGILQFDLSAIPATATIETVRLEVAVAKASNAPRTITLHKSLKDWGEGTANAGGSRSGGGADAVGGDATWLHTFSPDQTWDAPGGDFASAASGSAQINRSDATLSWSDGGLLADVQAWISDPSTNFGWFLVGENANKSTIHFATRESNSPPQLTVTYSEGSAMANVQIVHNAADPAAAVVDVYVNGALGRDDLEFRTATPFISLPAGEELAIAIAPGTSQSAAEALETFNLTLEADSSYIVMAAGVLNPENFDNTVNEDITFNLYVFEGARQSAMNPVLNADLIAFHGVTDAPAVGVSTTVFNLTLPVVDSFSYPNYTPAYAEVPLAAVPPDSVIVLDVFDVSTGDIVNSYVGDLAAYLGQAITVYASGFLNPADNQDGEPFGIFIVNGAGETEEIPPVVSSIERIELLGVQVFPNPSSDWIQIQADDLDRTPVTVRLYNAVGMLLREVVIQPERGTINLDLNTKELPTATYLLKLSQNNKVAVEQIIVQH